MRKRLFLKVAPRRRGPVPEARFVTDFGDQAVLSPLAIGVALVFAFAGWRRGALA